MESLTTLQPIHISLDSVVTDKRLQNRNVGMQKFEEHNDGKRYKAHVADLRRSIRSKGQKTPIHVVAAECDWILAEGADKPHSVPTKFFLVDGHHRMEALHKEGAAQVLARILPGLGFLDALDACRLSNQDVVQGMSQDERTENAWSAMNQARNTYRRLPIGEVASLLGASESTIKRFRSAIRQDGIEAGKIDPDASRDKAELQLQDYWDRMAKRGLQCITWRMHKQGRRKPASQSSAAATRHKIKMAVIQALLGTDGMYDPDDVVRALE
ncbi:ParB N-terminal domain-containing protein [Pseudomonas seleniipraecipitans]|uniref:ParB N-terminal domain-containing protein n=1 Tax=Phytopseudomonas seleniipraecipitans TaxID=640205 RepID=A0ABY5JFL0_9GAMM|nr:ParB N-terminal domain-containing protein [Pseudomonas seleniipraecipitans]UUD65724.1 ParB N-terminal domain-containing protein [Pseudomonas seleniipraecipitans]